MERSTGIEPASMRWQRIILTVKLTPHMEEAVGFEPTHAFDTPNCFQNSPLYHLSIPPYEFLSGKQNHLQILVIVP